MTRESKNNNDGAVFTYHERRKMDHGTTHLRLPAAALKPWHHCALQLSPAETPVITPQGVLYDREAILVNLLQQKQRFRVERLKRDAEQHREERERAKQLDARRREEEAHFAERQGTVHFGKVERSTPQIANDKLASNFWLPGADDARDTGAAHPAKRRKKDTLLSRTVCPVTGKPLKSRDLITLQVTHFERQSEYGKSDDAVKSKYQDEDSRTSFMCPVCQTALVNSVRPVALRTGTVICKRCADDFVKKEARDPTTGIQLDIESDVIEIQNSGTAFAASSLDNPNSKEAKLYRPSVR